MQTNGRRRLDPWVGPWLQRQRLKSKPVVTREAIAAKIGRDTSAVGRIESGRSSIPADDLPVFLDAYGLTPAQFAAEARKPRAAA